ncbi:hypothetical protein BV898_17429 [Hypsibius exemplaris]|uniref:Uncharacterized protein n=1 Tax=Hypsibius exemplaris TaxID=2072580 RepID=A0A9X6NM79_HYPEX|nr:hypothetical protein BV898_17429 [Hypsibius exemplaris]
MNELNERAQIRLLEEGGVPDVPSELPSPLRQLVLGCLKVVPANRPKAKTLLNLLTPNGGLHGLEDDTAQSAVGAASEEPAFQTPFSMVMGVGSD